MTLLNRLLSVIGILGFAGGPIGFGRIWVLGLMPGFGRILFPQLPFLSSQTQSSQILVEPHLIDAEFREAWMPFF